MGIDEILRDYDNQSNTNNFDKESWIKNKNKQRAWAYEEMEKMTQKIKDNCEELKKYLDVQSKFEKYSVGNNLLIFSQQPDATLFRDKQGWKENNISLVANPKPIIILTTNNPKEGENRYYNTKEVYDISETNAEAQVKQEYDEKRLLKSFMNNCYATNEIVNELPNNRTGETYYDKEKNTIYIRRAENITDILNSLAYSLAEIEMRGDKDDSFKDFKCKCISYMLLKKYGLDNSNYTFSEIPQEICKQEKGKDIRDILDQIRTSFVDINERIVDSLENRKRKENQKEHQAER